MLSRAEIRFLREPEAFSPEYARILRFRIKRKISKLKETLSLLMESEFSDEIASFITENCNALQNSVTPKMRTEKPNLNCFSEISWCGGWDLNPRRPTPEDLKSSPLS